MRTLLLLCALFLAACGDAPAGAARARNLVLISIDTLRPDHLGCYGYERPTSPAIDALAARGVRFADVTSSAPWTLPAHATMFTGLYPSHHGVKAYENTLPERITTLAEALGQQGFQTLAAINTWNIADPRFDVFQGFAPEHLRYVRESEKVGGRERILNTGPEVVAEVEALLGARDPARPFFLFVHFYDVHTDYTPEPAYRERFVGPYPGGKLDGSTAQLFEVRARGLPLSPGDVRFLEQMYDAEIAQLDDVLAGFLERLGAQGLLDDTLVALTSDHGEEFYEHGGLLHGRTQFQELVSVPLILAGPGLPAGRVVEEPVSLVDLYPTLLAHMGVALPGPVDGLDLAPTWSAPAPALPPRVLLSEADHNNVVDGKAVIDIKRMARLGSEKLHVDRLTDAAQLFDLASDPGERADLAGARAEHVAVLRAALQRHLDGQVAGAAHGVELAPEELELLRGLGYAGDEDGAK